MAVLFKSLRVHQIFAANTDVGKTVFTTALCIATAKQGERVLYLKPVSTGPLQAADDVHVSKYARRIDSVCLYRYDDAVSPHLASKMQGSNTLDDSTLVRSVAEHIRKMVSSTPSWMAVETAGGVHSPTPAGTSQADTFRPLRLPIVLIGDHRLGGISATLSAYESLHIRGFDVDHVLAFRDKYYQNHDYLADWFAERGVPFDSISPPPPKHLEIEEDERQMANFYTNITRPESTLAGVVKKLQLRHDQRIESLASMPRRTLDSVWYPFVQHDLLKDEGDVTVIDSAYGDFFVTADGPKSNTESLLRSEFDGSASWWTQALGHSSIELTMAAAHAAGRYGHVIFPQASHAPALELAERLLKDEPGRGWAARVFFSDNGSTGMEVALKMALRAYAKRTHLQSGAENLGVLGLAGAYHGDTIGSMDACEGGVFNSAVEWYQGRGYWFSDIPYVGITRGQTTITWKERHYDLPGLDTIYDVEPRLKSDLANQYDAYIQSTLDRLSEEGRKFGALCIEPLVLGAGGMIFVDPLFQRVLIDVVRRNGALFGTSTQSPASSWMGLPVIFDEVFTGLRRLSMQTPMSVLGTRPDIAVYAKILTGGLLPLAATLASGEIFDAFRGSTKAEALLHGHSYTAHPIGCAVANKTLHRLKHMENDWQAPRAKWTQKQDGGIWSFWDPGFVNALSQLPGLSHVMAMGTVLTFELYDQIQGYSSGVAQQRLFALRQTKWDDSPTLGAGPFAVHYRSLGNVGYFMCSLNTKPEVLREVERAIHGALSSNGETSAPPVPTSLDQ